MDSHVEANHSWCCGHCSTNFLTGEKLAIHRRKTQHCYCAKCDRFFVDTGALNQHVSKSPKHPKNYYRCCDCDRRFKSELSLQQHLTAKNHHACIRDKKLEKKPHCKKYDLAFATQAEITKHRRCGIQSTPQKTIQCISKTCNKRFKSLSALISHLEQGRCASGITRQKINSLIQTHDTGRFIMEVPANDCVSNDTDNGSSTTWDAVATPSTESTLSESEEWDGWNAIIASNSRSSISYAASEDVPPLSPALGAHVSSAHLSSTNVPTLSVVCPLCPSNGRHFISAAALQAHMSSTAHEKRIFHCPTFSGSGKRGAKKTRSFANLSGLLSHLEVGVCQGGIGALCETAKYLDTALKEIGLGDELLKLYNNL